MEDVGVFVGLDVHKETITVALAEGRRDGEVRFWGNIPNSPERLRRLAQTIVERHGTAEFTYEAGPCGYAVYR